MKAGGPSRERPPLLFGSQLLVYVYDNEIPGGAPIPFAFMQLFVYIIASIMVAVRICSDSPYISVPPPPGKGLLT